MCNHVRVEALTAVVLKSFIFLDITPCSPMKVNQRFGGTCRFHIQGQRISQARNQRKAGNKVYLISQKIKLFMCNNICMGLQFIETGFHGLHVNYWNDFLRRRFRGCYAMQFRESQRFRRGISHPFSGWKNEASKKPAEAGDNTSNVLVSAQFQTNNL
jgi:hypothetical protein